MTNDKQNKPYNYGVQRTRRGVVHFAASLRGDPLTQNVIFQETNGGDGMSYYFNKTVDMSFDDSIDKVTEELKKEGFGVLTEIDVKAALKKKINVDFRKYRILGACNPSYAHKALLAEDKIGTMLPCNIVVQEREDGKVEVAAIDPVASMQSVKNESLGEIATIIRSKLKQVIDNT